jgi:hypothetical protein
MAQELITLISFDTKKMYQEASIAKTWKASQQFIGRRQGQPYQASRDEV